MTDPSRAPAPRPGRDPDLRASHADREAVAELLRQAAGDGRIDLEELEERLERAFSARTYGELAPLTADLPVETAAVDPRDEQPMELRSGVGDLSQAGHWVVPSRITAVSRMGNIVIDFTQAVCRHSEVFLEVNAGMGNVTVIVPVGWSVRSHGLKASIGSVRNRATEPPEPGAPTLEVSGRAAMGDVRIRHLNRWETWRRRDRSS
ncbi:DUF1707 domain-containing protein [Streptomyces sp. 549]|uniref:DUF1707 SHOCT-like domain-containing protein n=1 Tax=Streptomyces sp. 549 TaxID=3049076 RepID=UPI0024C43275|nr:DUF1707 domain-containing protein [Streptomyces sp. 549]MDK1472795.1 DUF1707 domain-containing protein [Streptomyces sp. 549]